MIFIESTYMDLDKQVKAVCAPLFATGLYLQGGHDETTTNATVTFVQFESRIYAVTCHHVLSAFLTESLKTGHLIVPSIHSGKSIHHFHSYGPEGQSQWSFISCRDFPSSANINDERALAELERSNAEKPDIAIAELTNFWSVIQGRRAAEAINLDDWTEPDWSVVQPIWLAYGFPNAHKYITEDKVAAPMPRVAVELGSSVPSADKPTYTLCSTLALEHGWGFSGLSGGPVMAAHATEDRYAYVGITYEGLPSTKEMEEHPESFIGKSDIILRGYHLTPTTFQDWLSQRKYIVALS